MNEIQRFRELVEDIQCAWPDCPSTTDTEPYLLKVLELVKSAPELQVEFTRYFVEYLDRAKYDYDLLVFCMRELQWPEVREAVKIKFDSSTDWRTKMLLRGVLEVYEDDWEDADLWNYYGA